MELAACIGVGDEVFLVNIVVCLAYIRVAGWGGGWGCSCYCGLVPDANRVVGSCVKAERGSYFVDKSTGWLWVCRRTLCSTPHPSSRGRAIVPSACMDGRRRPGGAINPRRNETVAVCP